MYVRKTKQRSLISENESLFTYLRLYAWIRDHLIAAHNQ